MEFLFVISLILILFSLVLPFKLQLKVKDPTCAQEVKAVKNNKIGLITCAAAGITGLLVSLLV